tara:strand:- start:878 stop:1225 length:348 start_codon:yes stop_codon:yes gene_type:complete
MTSCSSNIPLNEFSRLSYNQKTPSVSSRNSALNVPRFRNKSICSITCLDTGLSTWFKNSVNNQYLAPIPYAVRLKNLIHANQIQGTSFKIKNICVDKQYGRKCGTGGMALTNKLI